MSNKKDDIYKIIFQASDDGDWEEVIQGLEIDPVRAGEFREQGGLGHFRQTARDLLHVAAIWTSNVDALKRLIDQGEKTFSLDFIPMQDAIRDSAWWAIFNPNIEILKYLVEQGADTEETWDRNETLLHAASSVGTVEILEYLVSRGADVNAKDDDGKTPLHTAAKNKNMENWKYLVSQGADVNAKDNIGMTPLHYRKENNHES